MLWIQGNDTRMCESHDQIEKGGAVKCYYKETFDVGAVTCYTSKGAVNRYCFFFFGERARAQHNR
jgi:hypothetical protein